LTPVDQFASGPKMEKKKVTLVDKIDGKVITFYSISNGRTSVATPAKVKTENEERRRVSLQFIGVQHGWSEKRRKETPQKKKGQVMPSEQKSLYLGTLSSKTVS